MKKKVFVKIINERGISAVEFALLLPLLALLLFGIIEFGLMLYDQQEITNASREGARKGAVYEVTTDVAGNTVRLTKDQAYISNYVVNDCLTIGGKSRLISYGAVSPNVTVTPASGCTAFGANLTVTVDYSYDFLALSDILGFFGTGSKGRNLHASTTMRCE